MKKIVLAVLCVFSLSIFCAAGDDVVAKARLRGLNEVPPINSAATGTFKAVAHADGTITFTLTWANLAAPATVSHIHFAFPREAGGVMIFLCGGDAQPACPAVTTGSITGTIAAVNVVGPAGQGIAAGDLASALRAVGAGAGYVNIHDAKFPAGEIRGQVRVFRRDHDHDGDDD